MIIRRDFRLTWFLVLCGFAATIAAAPELPPAPEMFKSSVDDLEAQIASRIVRRPNTPAPNQIQLELEIDLRVIVRWMLQQALDAQPGTDLYIAAYFRASQMHEALVGFDDALRQLAGTDIGKSQTDAMKRLHDLSYALPQAKDVAALDGVSGAFGGALLAIAYPTLDARKLPSVRPTPRAPATGTGDGDPAPTLAQLEAQARQATVSVPLRQQLLALWTAADKAQRDPRQADLAAELLATLRTAVELARGLETNTGVSLDQRQRIQDQLLEGLALYMDPRTQAAGLARINSLRSYRRLLQQVDDLGLSPEQRQAVGPALTFARDQPRSAPQVLGALEAFVDAARRYALLPAAEQNRIGNLRGAAAELRRQFELAAQAFLVSAGQNGRAFDVSPGDFAAAAQRLVDQVALLEAIVQMPHVLDVANSYRPKNLGSLERRILTTATTAAGEPAAPGRDEAATVLRQLAQLVDLSDALEQRSGRSDAARAEYLAGNVETLQQRWRAAVADQIGNVAGGAAMDAKVLQQMRWLLDIYDAIEQAVPAETAAARTQILCRWVDWNVSVSTLNSVLMPWRRATAGLAAALFRGAEARDYESWLRLRRRYAPLLALLARTGAYVPDVQEMPEDFAAQLVKLMTPLDERAFAAQRYASAALAIWASKINGGDDAAAEAAGATIAARLAQMLGLRYRAESLAVPNPTPRREAPQTQRTPDPPRNDEPPTRQDRPRRNIFQ